MKKHLKGKQRWVSEWLVGAPWHAAQQHQIVPLMALF